MGKADLLQTWAQWKPHLPPFVFDGDAQVLNAERSRREPLT
jgi:hypothetical protein